MSEEKKDGRHQNKRVMKGCPVEELATIAYMHAGADLFRMEMKRRLPSGGWANIKAFMIPPHAVISVPDLVQAFCGGGTIVFSVTDAQRKHIISWEDDFEGLPKRPIEGTTIVWSEPEKKLLIAPEQDSPSRGFTGVPSPMAQGAATYAGSALPAGSTLGAPPPFPAPVYDAQGGMRPPPDDLLSKLGMGGWAKTYPAPVLWEMTRDEYTRKYGMAPAEERMVQDASREREIARVDAAQSRMMLDSERSRYQQQVEIERTRTATLEREIERLKAREETRSLEMKFASIEAELRALRSAPPVETKSIAEQWAPFVPVLVAWVESQGAAKKAPTGPDPNVTLVVELMKSQMGQKPADPFAQLASLAPLLAPLGAMVGPVLVKWFENQSPSAQAELLETRMMGQQMYLKMMADFIMSQQPQGEKERPWWQEAILKLIGEAGDGMRAGMLAGGMPQLGPPQQRPSQMQQMEVVDAAQMPQNVVNGASGEPAVGPSAPSPAPSYPAFDHLYAHFASIDQQAAQYTKMVFDALAARQSDPRYFTQEWVMIIFNLHAKLEVEQMVAMFVDHLEHSRAFNILPTELAGVFEAPEEKLSGIVRNLPVYLAGGKDYADEVIRSAAEEIIASETERKKVEAEEAEEEAPEEAPEEVEAQA